MAALSEDLAESAAPVADAGRQALDGAGQFGGDLDAGITTFVMSWRAVLDVFGESATAVSRLMNHTVASVEAADRHLARVAAPR